MLVVTGLPASSSSNCKLLQLVLGKLGCLHNQQQQQQPCQTTQQQQQQQG
jgi:hypothetical protein